MRSIKVDIAEDRFSASITVEAEGEEYPAAEELLRALNEAGVVFGIDAELIEEIAREKLPVQQRLVAGIMDAVQSMNDQSGYIWHIAENFRKKPAITEHNRADFKKIKVFEAVKKGQPLLSLDSDKSGADMQTVTGEQRPALLPAGQNTRISEDGLTLYADSNGFAIWDAGRLHVHHIYHAKGDIDYSTGNIKFKGPVVVDGDIRSGFRVEAAGSVYVGGNVEAASVYAQNGDIHIECGIVGQGRAKILSGGNLKCGFIQDATVSVRGDVFIQHYSINSEISSGGSIILTENEGLIRGGTVTAERGIIAREIGSDRGAYTEIIIRSSGENESQTTLWTLSKKRADLLLRQSSLKKRSAFLELIHERSGGLSEGKKKELQFIASEIERLEKKVQELDQTELRLQKESSKEILSKEIRVLDTVHRNVRIDIGGSEYFTDSELKRVKFARLKGDLVIESLHAMDSADYDIFIPGTYQK